MTTSGIRPDSDLDCEFLPVPDNYGDCGDVTLPSNLTLIPIGVPGMLAATESEPDSGQGPADADRRRHRHRLLIDVPQPGVPSASSSRW